MALSSRRRAALVAWSPVAIAVLAVLVAGFFVLRPSPQPTLLGEIAPPLKLQLLNGTPVSLAALRGRPVVLNFWGVSCPPCRQEVPVLQQAYEQYHKTRGLVILGIDAQEDDNEGIAAFAAEHGATYPMVRVDPDSVMQSAYKVDALPRSFLIDRQGIVRLDETAPFLNVQALDTALRAVL
jgi:cytochrome c biogenesis protein CcmG/thiol:disulfide interchange protein DsbE